MQRMGIFEGPPTCRWCGKQEETGEHLKYIYMNIGLYEEVKAFISI